MEIILKFNNMQIRRIILALSAIVMSMPVFAQGLRVDDLGNRNVIVRIDDLSKKYLLLPVQEDVPHLCKSISLSNLY